MLKSLDCIITSFLFLIIFSGCELDKVEINNWTPEFVSPLINTTLTIADLIPEKGSTQYDEDGFIRLAVRDDSVYTLSSASFINLPNQLAFEEEFVFSDLSIDDFVQDTIFTLEEIVVGAMEDPLVATLIDAFGITVPFPETQSIPGTVFNLINEELIGTINFSLDDFSSASFETGTLIIEITNNLPLDIENMEVDINTGQGNVGTGQLTVLSSEESQFFLIDLAQISIDNQISVSFLDLTLENVGTQTLTITPNSGFEISFSITDISVYDITMVFEEQELYSESSFFDFNLDNEEQIHSIILSAGQISYSITSSLVTPISIIFSIPSGMINNEPFMVVEDIQLTGNSVVGDIDVTGLYVDLTTDLTQPFNKIPLDITVLVDSDVPITLTNTDFANISFSFSNLELEYLDGYFSNYVIDLGGDTVDVDLGLFEDFDSGLILENPTFTINLKNSLGVSAEVVGELTAYSQDGSSQAGFDFNEVISAPTNIGDEMEISWTYDHTIIGDIIALPPKTIEYSSVATIINESSLNFVTNESSLLIGVDIDFPLSLNAANISLKDTILFSELNYDITQIEHFLLHFNLINGFPLGTKFDLVLHDSISTMNLDTISFVGVNSQDNIISPAIVDEQGYVIEPVLTSGLITLSKSEINSFLNTNKIIVDISLSTSNNVAENQYVKLYSDYECVLKMGVEIELNLD